MANIKITLNGEEKIIKDCISVKQLIENLDLKQTKFAVDINGEIIQRSKYDNYQIQRYDNIEIVVAVGGG